MTELTHYEKLVQAQNAPLDKCAACGTHVDYDEDRNIIGGRFVQVRTPRVLRVDVMCHECYDRLDAGNFDVQ